MPEEKAMPSVPDVPNDRISIEDFAKVQMRVGQITEAEKIEGSRKLVKLRVDLGTEVRQVVAGIADAYDPASLLNRKVVVVANLKPAKLMGVESNGMVVAASVDGKPVLATFPQDMPNGTLLKDVRHTGASMIADSHAHLDMPLFDSDRDDVIRRARDCGVELLITIGTGNPAESSVEKTIELAEKHDFIYAGLGV